jgi:hypothetical protein
MARKKKRHNKVAKRQRAAEKKAKKAKKKGQQDLQYIPYPTTARRRLEDDTDPYLDNLGNKGQRTLPLSSSSAYLLGQGQQYAPSCYHRGDTPLFTYDGCTFMPANNRGLNPKTVNAQLIIDCGNVVDDKPAKWVRGPGRVHIGGVDPFDTLNQYLANDAIPPVVKLDWRDYGVPPVGVDIYFWKRFLSMLPKGNIVVCCQGGHGRTGTCLAALAVASGMTANDAIALVREQHCKKAIAGMTANDAIALVREQHCKKAIETDSQLAYIKSLGDQAVEAQRFAGQGLI